MVQIDDAKRMSGDDVTDLSEKKVKTAKKKIINCGPQKHIRIKQESQLYYSAFGCEHYIRQTNLPSPAKSVKIGFEYCRRTICEQRNRSAKTGKAQTLSLSLSQP